MWLVYSRNILLFPQYFSKIKSQRHRYWVKPTSGCTELCELAACGCVLVRNAVFITAFTKQIV